MGDLEDYRPEITFARTRIAKAGELFWMKDTTPHESLPVTEAGIRQFFRLVTSRVTIWYERQSTKNRLGTLPAAEIATYDKFAATPPQSATAGQFVELPLSPYACIYSTMPAAEPTHLKLIRFSVVKTWEPHAREELQLCEGHVVDVVCNPRSRRLIFDKKWAYGCMHKKLSALEVFCG